MYSKIQTKRPIIEIIILEIVQLAAVVPKTVQVMNTSVVK